VSSNTITVTGGTAGAPVTFLDFWNADKAGTLSLHARTGITAVDGAAVPVTRGARPTDFVVVGGSTAPRLYITVTGWSGLTNATIRITGTNRDGASQTEDIAFTANATKYAAKYWKTVTYTQVTVFTGTGSFNYELKQGQWGVVWKLASNSFHFDARVIFGNYSTATYFTDTAKHVSLFDHAIGGAIAVLVTTNATVTFGQLDDYATRSTSKGCSFLFGASIWARGIVIDGGICYLYSCVCRALSDPAQHITVNRMWNCIVDYCEPFTAVDTYNCIYSRCTMLRTRAGCTVNQIFVVGTGYIIGFYWSPSVTLSNVNGATSGALSIMVGGGGMADVSAWFIDCIMNKWTFNWDESEGLLTNTTVYRQYTFDLKVTDKDNNNVSGATVTLKNKYGDSIFIVSTAANGTIATQTVTRGYYNKANGSDLIDESPHTLTITKAGYQTYLKKFTLTAKITWEIKLAKAQHILLNSGRPVLNLKPSEPENKSVVVL
jgi:hypothetical protein